MSFTEREPYKCFVCGKTGVKLWCNCHAEEFICAECAEKRQVPLRFGVGACESEYDGPLLPRWTIDEKGTIPSYLFSGSRDSMFIVDLRDVSDFASSGCTSYMPAEQIEQDDDGEWYYVHDGSVPGGADRWNSLPTRVLLLYAGA